MKLLHICPALLMLFLVAPSSRIRAADTRTPWFGGAPKADVINVQLPATIKVSLLRGKSLVSIGSTGGLSYTGSKLKKPVTLARRTVLKIHGGKKGMSVGGKLMNFSIRVKAADADSHLILNGRAYRGTLLVRPRGKGIDVIEEVGLEDYLNGVLPREVGFDWPEESLKAQAVISRTFVVANLGRNAAKGYDVSSDVFSQVYGGLQDEHPASNAAVAATHGEILVDDKGTPVLTFFHSSCGGETENPKYVWQDLKDAPSYLDSVKDSYCKDDPFSNWEYNISAETLQKRLRRAGYKGGPIKKVSIAKTSPSDRVVVFDIESAHGHAMIPGNAFRLAVGAEDLRSTKLTKVARDGKRFHFEGHGWGHGVGLCQWGARGRAAAGQSYSKILEAYYLNVRLVKAVEQPVAETKP